MKELIEQLESEFLKLPSNMEWHQISEKESNRMKNFNNGLKKAIEKIKEYEKTIFEK